MAAVVAGGGGWKNVKENEKVKVYETKRSLKVQN